MNEHENKLSKHLNDKKAEAIIDGKQNELRNDGYSNMLNKYGTKQDNSTAYHFNAESYVNDMELEALYEGNGLFKKIIDRPSEEAVKHGLDIDFGDEKISEYVEERLDDLGFESKFASAEKWARLYGGSIIVMIVDDGKGLEEPLCFNQVHSIKELRVFERAIVQPDYNSMYRQKFINSGDIPFGEPEFYYISSMYGYFRVHRTRCLVFKNGELPENSTNELYRYWGIPEYVKVKRALRECITTHENGTKLLERSVQAIYKMKNLANMLSTTDGEDKVLQRLQVIDMARGILNSIAIDTDGEDYDFKTITMSGVKDIIDSTCNMLSAVTDIPQTILFGRSPSGMNSTGESDTENYYNMVENIQKQNMKSNVRLLINLILKQAVYEGIIDEAPKYKVKFAALWSLTESEKADIESKNASTEHIKAQTVEIYLMNNIIDPSEVRKTLANDGVYDIDEPDDNGKEMSEKEVYKNEIISIEDTSEDEDDSIIHIEDDVISIVDDNKDNSLSDEHIHILSEKEMNGTDVPAAAVIIINDGKILCAIRKDNGLICGPGGHVEDGESIEETAVRETIEEFNIKPLKLIPLGVNKPSNSSYLSSMIYFTDEYTGLPIADGKEMLYADWLTLDELKNKSLYPPFEDSLKMLTNFLKSYLTSVDSTNKITISDNFDGGPGSGNWGHSGRPGKLGGSGKGGGKQHRTGTKESGYSSEAKERAKVKETTKKNSELKEKPKFVVNNKSSRKLLISHNPLYILQNNSVEGYDPNYTISGALKSNDKKVKKAIAMSMRDFISTKEIKAEYKTAKTSEQLDDFIKKYQYEYADRVIQSTERTIIKRRKTLKNVEKELEERENIDKDILSKCKSQNITPKEFNQMMNKKLEDMTAEEYKLEHAYTAENGELYGTSYRKLTNKMFNNRELSYAENRIVDMFSQKTTVLPNGKSIYRCTSISEINSLTGLDINKALDGKANGKTVKTDKLSSCSIGAPKWFDDNRTAIIEYVIKNNASGYITQNAGEGEIILPVGTTINIVSATKGTPTYPVLEKKFAGYYPELLDAKKDPNKIYLKVEVIGNED